MNPLMVRIAPEGAGRASVSPLVAAHAITLEGDMVLRGEPERVRRNLTAAEARDLARELLAAADVVDPRPAVAPPELDLEAIEARAALATPGPWLFEKVQHRWSESVHYTIRTAEPTGAGLNPKSEKWLFWMHGSLAHVERTMQPHEVREIREDAGILADAAFIVCARADVPALVAEVRRLRAELNTPELVDFLKGVGLEAAHQGSEHDAGKTDADWFWLIGYLVGKALHKPEKRLHHLITAAAALFNWHLCALGKTNMRPGIEPPAEVPHGR